MHVTSLGVEITLALYLDEACMVCASVMDEVRALFIHADEQGLLLGLSI